MKKISYLRLTSAMAGSICCVATAHAQTTVGTGPAANSPTGTGSDLPDIVVTAERRSTSLQKTPVAVTVISSTELAKANVKSLSDLQALVPSLKVASSSGYTQISVRGISSNSITPGSEAPVAFNLNEIYVSRLIAQQAGLFDVSRIEVLRGPQGTLYGRNATGGLVNVSTIRPTDTLSGQVLATIGNFDRRIEAGIGGPVVDDKVLVRIAAFTDQQRGYGKNLTTGNRIDDRSAYGVRGTVVVKPTSNVTATVITEYFSENDRRAGVHYFGDAADAVDANGAPLAGGITARPFSIAFGGKAVTNSFDIANSLDPSLKLDVFATTGIIDANLGAVSLKSITGYRDQKSAIESDISGASVPMGSIAFTENARQISQEFQARYNKRLIDITAGVYYFHENIFAPTRVNLSSINPLLAGYQLDPGVSSYTALFLQGKLKTDAAAAFAQATIKPTEKLSIILGGRYSWERRNFDRYFTVGLFGAPLIPANSTPTFNFIVSPHVDFTSFTPKVGLNYQINPTTMVYASYSKGFKSGGFDATSPLGLPFNPEHLTAYEAGLKATLFSNRLRTNLAAFYYDYKDFQVQQTIAGLPITSNAGAARIFGLEAELEAKISTAITIGASGSYINSKFLRYSGVSVLQPNVPLVDFSGNHLVAAPDFSGRVYANVGKDLAHGRVDLRGDMDFSSKFYFSPDNNIALGQRGYAKFNASLGYSDRAGWRVMAYVNNITNRYIKTNAVVNNAFVGSAIQGSVQPPRSAGVQFGYSF